MNKLTTVFALLSLLIFSTCSKDFLEVEPLVGSTEVNYYQNGNDAEAAPGGPGAAGRGRVR